MKKGRRVEENIEGRRKEWDEDLKRSNRCGKRWIRKWKKGKGDNECFKRRKVDSV